MSFSLLKFIFVAETHRTVFFHELKKFDGQDRTSNRGCIGSRGEEKNTHPCTPVLAAWCLTGSCLRSVRKSDINPLIEGAIYSCNKLLWNRYKIILLKAEDEVHKWDCGIKTRSKN